MVVQLKQNYIMNAISIKPGLYLFNDVIFERHNGKSVPVGFGFHKTESSPSFGNNEFKVRLRSLYNQSSVGPKEMVPPSQLPKYIIHVMKLEVIPSLENPAKPFHKVTWDVIIDEAHQDLIDTLSAIAMDFILQEEQEQEFSNQLLCDEYNINQQEFEHANTEMSDDHSYHEAMKNQVLPLDE